MFENVGDKLRKLAKIFSCVNVVTTTIIAFLGCVLIAKLNESLHLNIPDGFIPLSFIIVFLFGLIKAWLNNCILYAFGEITENLTEINKINYQSYLLQKNMNEKTSDYIDHVNDIKIFSDENNHSTIPETTHEDDSNLFSEKNSEFWKMAAEIGSKINTSDKTSETQNNKTEDKVCENCGAEVKNNEKFCIKCGTKQ